MKKILNGINTDQKWLIRPNYLIGSTFNKVNRLFVLSIQNEEDRISFSRYYTPKFETKDSNVSIEGKSSLDVPVKNKEETYQKSIEMSKIND